MTATKIQPGAVAGYRISDPSDPELGFWFSETPCAEGYTSEPLYAGAAPAAVAGPAPAGWRLVPATPTREWIAAVADGGYEDCDCASLIADILSRAPSAPALEAPAAPAEVEKLDAAAMPAQLSAIAAQAALDAKERHSYLPNTSAEAATWRPHFWVIQAMRAAIKFDRALNRAAAPQAPAAPSASTIPEAAHCALQYVEHALAAIANREEQLADSIHPVDTIGKASKRAKAALTRLQSVAHHFVEAAPAAPAVDAETVKKAARYDWLRDFHNGPDGVQANLPHIAAGSDNDLVWALIGEDADAGIDAAIAAQAAAKGADHD